MAKKEVKISMLQMSSIIGEVEANINKVKDLLEYRLPSDSDVLVLPEVWTVGWDCASFRASAQTLGEGSVHDFLSYIAKKNSINIIGGSYITIKDGKYYNTCPVYDRSGNLIAAYSKNHLYSYYGCDEDKYVSAGDSPVMVELDDVKFGLTICYDIRFPEIFREYRKAGADLLVNMAAWGISKPLPWEVLTRSRAIENQAYMVALTQSGHIKGDEWNIGHSRIIDYLGETIAEIKDQKQGIITCEINFNDMYAYRNSCTILKDIKKSYEVICV